MDSKLRAELIRQGNRAYNEGDYQKARDLFTKASYADGLIRIGDYYMYDKRLPLLAYGYYKRAGAKNKIEDLHRRMISAMASWLGEDKLTDESRAALKSAGLGPVPSPGPISPSGKAGKRGLGEESPVSPSLAPEKKPASKSTERSAASPVLSPISFEVDADGLVPIPVNAGLREMALKILGKKKS